MALTKEKNHPQVTIIVSVKNARTTIEKCIKSLLNLNYPNYKIHIADAFSTDGTYEILKKLKLEYSKKINLERIRGNIATVHNYLINKTYTEFVAMTDADCTVDNNWLKHLVSGFFSNDIIAAAGFCSTPKDVNRLQKLIGMELENRFKKFPKFISRAPTMNLCVRNDIAKKIKFDERFDVAQVTDWGYRLTKLGKMIYVPKAIIYHYHRSTLKNYFIQRFRYARAMPLLYFKHKNKLRGDHILRPIMIIEEITFLFFSLFILFSIFYNNFFWYAIILFFFLLSLYFIDILRFAKKPANALLLVFLYLLRSTAWTIGLIFGMFDLILNLF
jgi:glycosyltransferase involved in cell wall biosynthesis